MGVWENDEWLDWNVESYNSKIFWLIMCKTIVRNYLVRIVYFKRINVEYCFIILKFTVMYKFQGKKNS